MKPYLILIIFLCTLFLIVNLIHLILEKNDNRISNRKIYVINMVTAAVISNCIEWSEMQFERRAAFLGESFISLLNLINILLCLILVLFMLFVKNDKERIHQCQNRE
ncbi:hypothetical protein RZO55_17175 [Clostridium boliviensis]|uniref:Uncharacterized protein n=1 Tax=Clostridium boliviensis TaxID=318465 RepID=A0ABU4GNV8_9CLOT|nr:hypothetical protein [Clostridium boliviensis]MDW2799308.1 hypothetical protein [Clostridium boliviensis]